MPTYIYETTDSTKPSILTRGGSIGPPSGRAGQEKKLPGPSAPLFLLRTSNAESKIELRASNTQALFSPASCPRPKCFGCLAH